MSLNQQTIETNAQESSNVIHENPLQDNTFFIETVPHLDRDAIMEESLRSAVEEQPPVEQQIDLSMLPQNIEQCFGHPMWDLSKTCVVCGKRETYGAILCNPSLFLYFNCGCIRACPDHYDKVFAHFAKPEFNGPIVNPHGDYYVIVRCPECRQNFSTVSDSQNAFCGKGCQGNWLDRRF